eukprot:gene5328-8134_t
MASDRRCFPLAAFGFQLAAVALSLVGAAVVAMSAAGCANPDGATAYLAYVNVAAVAAAVAALKLSCDWTRDLGAGLTQLGEHLQRVSLLDTDGLHLAGREGSGHALLADAYSGLARLVECLQECKPYLPDTLLEALDNEKRRSLEANRADSEDRETNFVDTIPKSSPRMEPGLTKDQRSFSISTRVSVCVGDLGLEALPAQRGSFRFPRDVPSPASSAAASDCELDGAFSAHRSVLAGAKRSSLTYRRGSLPRRSRVGNRSPANTVPESPQHAPLLQKRASQPSSPRPKVDDTFSAGPLPSARPPARKSSYAALLRRGSPKNGRGALCGSALSCFESPTLRGVLKDACPTHGSLAATSVNGSFAGLLASSFALVESPTKPARKPSLTGFVFPASTHDGAAAAALPPPAQGDSNSPSGSPSHLRLSPKGSPWGRAGVLEAGLVPRRSAGRPNLAGLVPPRSPSSRQASVISALDVSEKAHSGESKRHLGSAAPMSSNPTSPLGQLVSEPVGFSPQSCSPDWCSDLPCMSLVHQSPTNASQAAAMGSSIYDESFDSRARRRASLPTSAHQRVGSGLSQSTSSPRNHAAKRPPTRLTDRRRSSTEPLSLRQNPAGGIVVRRLVSATALAASRKVLKAARNKLRIPLKVQTSPTVKPGASLAGSFDTALGSSSGEPGVTESSKNSEKLNPSPNPPRPSAAAADERGHGASPLATRVSQMDTMSDRPLGNQSFSLTKFLRRSSFLTPRDRTHDELNTMSTLTTRPAEHLRSRLQTGMKRKKATILSIELGILDLDLCDDDVGETFTLANELIAMILETIKSHEGLVLSFKADGVTAAWNTHLKPSLRHALQATQAARDIASQMDLIDQQARIGWSAGITSGSLYAGYIGSDRQRAPFVLGPCVEHASQLNQLARVLQTPVLLTDSAYE